MELDNIRRTEFEPSMQGHLYIISGFTGVGKDTVIQELVAAGTNCQRLMAYTTRPIRASETDGLEYVFINNDQFENMLLNNEFLQYITVGSGMADGEKSIFYYGTRKQDFLSSMQSGNTLWNLTINTASKVEDIIRSGFSAPIAEEIITRTTKVLLDVPRLTVSKDRARQRESMPNNMLLSRLRKQYINYIEHRNEFDFCIVNEDLEETIETLNSIIAK